MKLIFNIVFLVISSLILPILQFFDTIFQIVISCIYGAIKWTFQTIFVYIYVCVCVCLCAHTTVFTKSFQYMYIYFTLNLTQS